MDKIASTPASVAHAVRRVVFGRDTTGREDGDGTGHTQRAGDNASARRGDSLVSDSSDGNSSRTAVTEPDSGAKFRSVDSDPARDAPQSCPVFEDTGASGSRFQGGIPVADTTTTATKQAEITSEDDRAGEDHRAGVTGCTDGDAPTRLTASENLERNLHGEHGIHSNAADPTTSDRPQTTTSSLPGPDPDASLTGGSQGERNEQYVPRPEEEYALNAGTVGESLDSRGSADAANGPDCDLTGGSQGERDEQYISRPEGEYALNAGTVGEDLDSRDSVGAANGPDCDTSGHSQLRLGTAESGGTVSGGGEPSSDSGDHRSVDARLGLTRTESTTSASLSSGGRGGCDLLGTGTGTGTDTDIGSTTTTEGLLAGSLATGGAGNDASAQKSVTDHGRQEEPPSTLTGDVEGGPGEQDFPSVGAHPASGVSALHQQHQGSGQPLEDQSASGPDTAEAAGSGGGGVGVEPPQLNAPLTEGHPESNGSRTRPEGQKLPSGPGTGQGTGTQYVRSSGVAAEGGDFDAAAPGAGHEADRLLDERGVHHGFVGVKDKTHDTAPGKPSIGTDTAHSGSGSHGHKLSIGERIKEKFHSHHTKH